MNLSDIKTFYASMEKQKYPLQSTFVFVYNDYNTYTEDPHIEECFDHEEVQEILDSVRDIFKKTLSFGSEKDFITWAMGEDIITNRVYVYTMAQNMNGFGRRALIPALCQYLGVININADVYMSTIGCNKKTMYNLLATHHFNRRLAPTIFQNNIASISFKDIKSLLGIDIILKPISESCCIDVIVLKKYKENQLYNILQPLLSQYGSAMIQRYIPGKEIGITVFYYNGHPYAFPAIEIVFKKNKEYLTHDDSYFGNYSLANHTAPESLLRECEQMSAALDFHCITRYDFRFDGTNYYLIDISPNPTINGYTSSNLATQALLNCDHRGILRLMAYEKIRLFEPPLDSTN